ncbi:MAG: adenylate/guanylate cyclase domain-containing protein [Phycisphaeraceae bacterium]|nr:adenylate/guanylate cyclase domain-containing protein [Phycisphaeraceae bacterium]
MERRLLVQNVLIGGAVSVVVAVLAFVGGLNGLERILYDQRASWCQHFTSKPTDTLVHLDIDDGTLEALGAWPWPRTKLARMVDEIALAGAKAVALDVVFSEPQKARWEDLPEQPDLPGPRVDDDRNFAESLGKLNRSLLAVVVKLHKPSTMVERQAQALLRENLELDAQAVASKLDEAGIAANRRPTGSEWDNLFVRALHKAAYDRVASLLSEGTPDFEAIRAKLLPNLDPSLIGGSPLLNTLKAEHQRALSVRLVDRYAMPRTALAGAMPVEVDLPPIPRLAQSVTGTGFVTYLYDNDGVVREIPLLVDDGKRLVPQLGLALACAYLGVSPQQLKIDGDWLLLPRPGQVDLAVPMRHRWVAEVGRTVTCLFDIPWFGPREHWETMYDPQGKRSLRHLPLHVVWRIRGKLDHVDNNNRQLDKAISVILDDDKPWKLALDPARGKAYRDAPPAVDDTETRIKMVQWTRKTLDDSGWLAAFKQMDEATMSRDEKFQRDQLVLAVKALDEVGDRNRQLLQEVEDDRRQLREHLGGKAVLIGWTGTGVAADFVPTSLHTKCPGVVVHGAVFNALMTGDLWRAAPAWTGLLLTLGLGLAATAMVARFAPIAALLSCLTLALGYAAVNGLLLFDYGNLLVDLSGPLVVVGLVWSAGTLARFITERTERARITRRFRNYVDPALVNYVIEHPEEARLDGQQRELSVVFTDLAGFTTLTEKLREKTVPILNEYMGLMVPLIRDRRGYVNKFLGDGVMFFFGAPRENLDHAADAVDTALAMQQAMPLFNASLTQRELPNVKVRIGISTGPMVVGDAGSVDASDYTVLGDAVNLGARLESANKYTGTGILINQRTAEEVGDRFLLRPVGKLQVVGKTEGVMTYEPLAWREQAQDEQKRQAELSVRVVESYQRGDFAGCLAVVSELEAAGGPAKLIAMYRRQCQMWMAVTPGGEAAFSGLIVLDEK